MLVVKHAVTVSLELGICDLFTELLADALIILGHLKTARTVSASFLKSLLYCCYYFFILVKSNSRLHISSPFPLVALLYHTFLLLYVTKSQNAEIFLKSARTTILYGQNRSCKSRFCML